MNTYLFKRAGTPLILKDLQCIDEYVAWILFEAHMLKCCKAAGDASLFDRNRYTCELKDG